MLIFTIPNLLTLFRLFSLPAVIILFRGDLYLIAFGVFLIGMLTDALDGYIATRLNQQTTLGLYFDPVVDKIVILVLLYELAVFGLFCIAIAHLFLVRELLHNGIRAWAGTRGTVVGANWMGKVKLFLQTILIGWGLLIPVFVGPPVAGPMLTAFRVSAAALLVIAWGFFFAFAYRNRALLLGGDR